MFERFRSKKVTPAAQDSKLGSVLPRGLEVVEDDPETVWSMWDDATAAQEVRQPVRSFQPPPDPAPSLPNAGSPFGFSNDPEAATQPMGLDEKTPAQQAEDALNLIELHHARIAKTIRMMWGYRECSQYVAKLLMTGYDDTGHARMGFHQEAVNAMMSLGDLHDRIFGFEQHSDLDGFGGTSSSGREQRHRR
jgi:hypothetical protein